MTINIDGLNKEEHQVLERYLAKGYSVVVVIKNQKGKKEVIDCEYVGPTEEGGCGKLTVITINVANGEASTSSLTLQVGPRPSNNKVVNNMQGTTVGNYANLISGNAVQSTVQQIVTGNGNQVIGQVSQRVVQQSGKYNVNLGNAQGMRIGDDITVQQTSVSATGQGSVSIGGSVSNSRIVTGQDNDEFDSEFDDLFDEL